MILKDNLYKIKSVSSNQKAIEIELQRKCFIYKSHFPELPVTPGACIIQIADELIAGLVGFPVKLSSILNAKFLAVINPTETNCVTYNFKKIDETEGHTKIKISITVTNNNHIFTKLSLVYNRI